MTHEIEIFSAGKHTDSAGNTHTFTQQDLQSMASNYNPEKHEAPVVIGHPQMDTPAYGWVKSLLCKGNRLIAHLKDIDTKFATCIRQGRYKKVSAAFYAPKATGNPAPGVFSLRHVGFLGGYPPAVKGLKQVAFSEENENDMAVMERDFSALHQEELPENDDFSLESETEQERLEAIRTALDLERNAFEKEKISFMETQCRTQAEEFIHTLVHKGSVLPHEKSGLVDFMDTLNKDNILTFGEGTTAHKNTTSWDFFTHFLSCLPPRVVYGESMSFDEGADGEDSTVHGVVKKARTLIKTARTKGENLSASQAVEQILQKTHY